MFILDFITSCPKIFTCKVEYIGLLVSLKLRSRNVHSVARFKVVQPTETQALVTGFGGDTISYKLTVVEHDVPGRWNIRLFLPWNITFFRKIFFFLNHN